MGPSMNDQMGFPVRSLRDFSKASVSSQNASVSCSCLMKSTLLGTCLNAIDFSVLFLIENKDPSSQARDEGSESDLRGTTQIPRRRPLKARVALVTHQFIVE